MGKNCDFLTFHQKIEEIEGKAVGLGFRIRNNYREQKMNKDPKYNYFPWGHVSDGFWEILITFRGVKNPKGRPSASKNVFRLMKTSKKTF